MKDLKDEWEDEMQIKSPSRVMIRMGEMIIKGLEIGLQSFEKVKAYIVSSTKDLIKNVENVIKNNPLNHLFVKGNEMTEDGKRVVQESQARLSSFLGDEEESSQRSETKEQTGNSGNIFTNAAQGIKNVVSNVSSVISSATPTVNPELLTQMTSNLDDFLGEGVSKGEEIGGAIS